MFFPTLDSIATTNVLTIDLSATINEAIAKMRDSNHRNIIIVNHAIYYVLTTVDLIALKVQGVDFSQPLSSLDLKQVPTLPGNENVINAINIADKTHEYLCIVDDSDKLSGIVTNSDIIASVDPQIMLENISLQSLFEKRYSYSVVQQDDPMEEAIALLDRAEHDCLIVAKGRQLVGIITSKDILRYFKDTNTDHSVSDFMSSPLHTLPAETSIKEALTYVKEKHFKRIVVVNNQGDLIGIISQKDLIAQTYLRWSNIIKEHYHEIAELSYILEQRNKQLVQMATKDRLTGINNRHMFEEQFENERAYTRRYHSTLHLVILDIDHFKTVNDTYGHIIGDSVLREFATILNKNARSSDFLARWGGEEFVLLLHNSSDADAYKVAEKLRRTVAAYEHETVGQITCSVGLCRIDPILSLNENLSQADHALYQAKKGGRNRVCVYEAIDA